MTPHRSRPTHGRRLVLALGLALAATLAQAQTVAPLRVLFVGNSYTYTFDLPEVVVAVAAARGAALEVDQLTEPGAAIEDHLASGRYQERIAEGWDWVVLQQRPSSLPDSRSHLIHWTGRAAELARARGIRIALFSVWPALANQHTWSNAELSYHEAARLHAGCVLPVAAAWRLTRERHPSIGLYSGDELHASRAGTLLAALVIVDGFFPLRRGEAPPSLRDALPDNDWRAALGQADTLHARALEALESEKRVCARRR